MGKGEAVGRSLATQFEGIAKYKMHEPEESVKNKVAEILKQLTDAAPDAGFVVEASGSQCIGADGGVSYTNLQIKVHTTQFAE
jgi:hypothetical protein